MPVWLFPPLRDHGVVIRSVPCSMCFTGRARPGMGRKRRGHGAVCPAVRTYFAEITPILSASTELWSFCLHQEAHLGDFPPAQRLFAADTLT